MDSRILAAAKRQVDGNMLQLQHQHLRRTATSPSFSFIFIVSLMLSAARKSRIPTFHLPFQLLVRLDSGVATAADRPIGFPQSQIGRERDRQNDGAI